LDTPTNGRLQRESGRDRIKAEIVHFYAKKYSKMHFQNFYASQDARAHRENLLH